MENAESAEELFLFLCEVAGERPPLQVRVGLALWLIL